MNILENFKTVLFEKRTDFNGRSDRPEFWYFCLYATIVAGLCALVDNYLLGYTFFSIVEPWGEMQESGVLVAIWTLVTLVQSIALTARRLHDRGRSGWMQLGLIVPGLNFIVFYWLIREAKDTTEALTYVNPYGFRY